MSIECVYYAIYLPQTAERPEVSAFVDWLTDCGTTASNIPMMPVSRALSSGRS